ncbi:MAG: hypothetical protein DWQ36_22365 [Acidobacteria bacterium]|nr:MAG: hypothetical protein DWQ30_06685 [Acidobacteriota bacterium]REK00582.1 MAG: hypothetical protein DWQ36_22365 [Acidobacteriota bacterium]
MAMLTLLLVAAPGAASERWFHLKVDEHSSDGAEVTVNLPLSLIEMAFEMIPEDLSQEVSSELEVELNEHGFQVDQLRRLWEEVRYGDDATFLQVRENDSEIRVSKVGDLFVAETVGETDDVRVDIRFPLQVVDALFSSGTDRLDFAAAIRALADYGTGDMVTVRDRDSSVRIWIDDRNTVD